MLLMSPPTKIANCHGGIALSSQQIFDKLGPPPGALPLSCSSLRQGDYSPTAEIGRQLKIT